MLVTTKKILERANKEYYAVGHFNTNNMEITQAIISAAEETNAPVIVGTSQGALSYARVDVLYAMVSTLAKKSKVPIALHLDHGTDLKLIEQCIRAGWTSVMIDASKFPFEKNVELTKKVVKIAHNKKISVEAELGTLGGVEDAIKGKVMLTDPEQAEEFVKRTKIDALAVAVGTSHGAYKFKAAPKLAFDRIEDIKTMVKIPLVLHGASSVPKAYVAKANKYGAKIKGAVGVPEAAIKKAISFGINKVNTDTDLRMAFNAAVREFLAKNKDKFDPREILGPARDSMKEVVKNRIRLFGSAGKA